MKIVDKDPPSKEVQDVIVRFETFMQQVDFDDLRKSMANDQTPEGRCFLSRM